MNKTPFAHHQHAHCESGVTANLLTHAGIPTTEPMAFGLGAGLFFAHIPFLKVNGTPGTTFRTWPGAIFKRATERLKVPIATQKFSNAQKAMDRLDAVLDQGIPVGMQTSVYFLPYLPEAFRFHFNAHNLIVYGKANGDYLVSDPVMEMATTIAPADLKKARFAKGMPEPRGFMYYVKELPAYFNEGVSDNFKEGVYKGIKQTCFFNLSPPLPWFGNKAFNTLARQLEKYPKNLTPRKATLYLGNIIRMQEEIGTGGGGFRFLYAAFLQEAAQLVRQDQLNDFAQELTSIGDQWRHFAYSAARQMKNRNAEVASYDELAVQLRSIGHSEKDFFTRLQTIIKK